MSEHLTVSQLTRPDPRIAIRRRRAARLVKAGREMAARLEQRRLENEPPGPVKPAT